MEEKFIKNLSDKEQEEIINYILSRFNLQKCEETREFYDALIEYIKTVRRSFESFKKNNDEIIDLFYHCGYNKDQIISILAKEPSLLHSNKNDIFWRILLLGKIVDRKTGRCVRDDYLVHNPRILRISQDVTYSRIKYLESESGRKYLRNEQGLCARQITNVTHDEFKKFYGVDRDTLLQMYPFNNKAQLEVVSWKVNKNLLGKIYRSNLGREKNVKDTEENLIEFLESKDFEPYEIGKLQRFLAQKK